MTALMTGDSNRSRQQIPILPLRRAPRLTPPPPPPPPAAGVGCPPLDATETSAHSSGTGTAMEVAAYPDWSSLPDDLVATVMRALAIPDLLRAMAVCGSWRAAGSDVRRVRFPITDASPCLLYSCAADDADTATLCSISAGAAFKLRLPPPALRTRYVIGSGYGWVVAVNEFSNLQAFNPLTGAQVDLPPATGLDFVESSSDDQGRLVYNLLYDFRDYREVYNPRELRLHLYYQVHLSCSPSAGSDCIVLLLHKHSGELSFARIGDDRWTWISTDFENVPLDSGYRTVAYNKNDGLFYVLSTSCFLCALDLNGPSPVAKLIIRRDADWDDPTRSYFVFAPWGDILLVARFMELRRLTTPIQVPPEHAEEVHNLFSESSTYEMLIFKLDVDAQKLVEISCSELRDHALFLGFNSAVMLSTKDFPRVKPNCAYLTDDNWEQIIGNMYSSREVGIWNFETQELESLDDLQSIHPWLNWPPPIWIAPSLS
ncbi:hypothetical protein ACP70R_007462 [Stipagrostis hirtigluma subsp. patula]